ncbi:MAG: oxidoreductase [Nitrospira sp. SG-bin1]|nr:MAG: oxidoreductase [Nitrospira sp. SG-bin1]
MDEAPRSLALVTGASTGIGYGLAQCCAEAGFDLFIAADEPAIEHAAEDFRALGASVTAVQADLATHDGVAQVCEAAKGRPIDALLANAGRGLGGAFLDQRLDSIRHVLDTNIYGTILLLHQVGAQMRARKRGRILIVGSIAGFVPGSFQAVYCSTKAFLDSFSIALRNELKCSGVTVTCLMPGPTDTEFFRRAGMMDTRVAQEEKDDPIEVARIGFRAMMRGDADVVSEWKNKLRSAAVLLTPSTVLAEMHRRWSEPGSGEPAAILTVEQEGRSHGH